MSIYLIVFFILAIFVITSEANIEGQINDKMSISGGGFKTWLNEVNGYDQNDPVNGYAGIIGEPITSIRISGGQKYISHVLDEDWLGEMTGNNQNDVYFGYSGTVNGKPIDAIAIDGGVEYAVHILRGEWLNPISKYDITDDKAGYAGIIGKPIDAIMIKGRTYAVSYTDMSSDTNTSSVASNTSNTDGTTDVTTDKCTIQGGTCMNPNSCDGTVLQSLCPGETNSYKCCVPIVNKNNNQYSNNSSSNVLSTIFIITSTLAVLMIITVSIFYYFTKRSSKLQNPPLNSPSVVVVDELPPPPPYTERIEDNVKGDLGNIKSHSLDEKIGYHSQVRMFSHYPINQADGLNSFTGHNQNRYYTAQEKSIKKIHPEIKQFI